ncbi:helix-hairpin-helix domain-containing protein, partial [Streptomyces sp. NPDC055509]
GKTPEIKGEQKPEGDVPGANVPEPSWWDIAVTIGAQLFGKLLKEILPLDDLIDSILGLPTKDEGLKNARVGDAPRLPLENDSDPRRTDEQGRKLDERKNELHQSGRDDAARPMGEDQIYPDVPKETLTGKVAGGKKTAKGGGARSVSGGGVPIESASAVAEHDRGPQIQAGFSQGRDKMGQERRAKDKKAADDRKQHDQDLQKEVTASGKKQSDARDKGRSDIADSRDRWRGEQDAKVSEIDGKKGKKYDKVRDDIKKKEEDTDKDVDKRTEDDNKKIDDEQTGAEKEAEKKQEDGKDDADNWLEEAIEKLKEFFEKLKNAIKSVFEKARQVVTDLIDKFKQQVFKLIDDARNWVIDQINTFADALIALGDELLADYPAMRDKWRNTIDGARDWAVQKVNEAADALKEVAGKLLDGLCGALLAGLDALEGGLLAAVDIAETVTVGALEFGAAAVAALGEWAAIFNDIVSDPGDWISKAGAAAETGAKEHLFEEIKTAVRAWFNQKVQEIIGIPMEDFQELISGGVTVEQMAQMAWDEALPQLPVIIGVMVVEKVVAKLIPGAGWVMAVIDALQTAWGALSEILAAFGLFMDFLKSVKSGNGALPFAKAVAAGVVALLELVYEFLIEGVGRFMGKVAERLGGMLKNLRTKKNKPGPSDDKPDAPAKPKDERPAPTDDRTPSPDRPADKPGTRPTSPRKPSPDKTSRPPSKPRPGKRSAPEKKRRPAHTTRPKRRRDDDERRDEGREVNAARKRMRDADRRLKDDDRPDRRDTPPRRGPARDTMRPDRRRDANDRDRDRDPKDPRTGDRRADDRRRDDDRRSDRRPSADRRDQDRRRADDRRRDTDKDRPRRRPLRRARQTIKSAVNRARRAAGKLFGKARRRVGNGLNERLRRLREQWRRRQERTRERDKRRTPDRDRQREPEGRKDYDLPQVRFRTMDGDPHTLLFKGKGRSADLATRSRLQGIREYLNGWSKEIAGLKDSDPDLWARQDRALRAAEAQHHVVEGAQDALPPTRSPYGISGRPLGDAAFQRQVESLRTLMESLAELLEQRQSAEGEPPLPPTVLPPFADGPLAFNFKASYIKKSTPAGTEAENRTGALPEGWNAVPTANDERKNNWVRMHMLPARLGGHASTSNLVPARKINNNDAANVVEHPAARALGHVVKGVGPTGKPEKMIWYDVDIAYWPNHKGFPKNVDVTWGGYQVTNNQWVRDKNAKGSWPGKFDPPGKPSTVNVNTAAATTIRAATGISPHFAEAIVKIREQGIVFNKLSELTRALQARLDLAGSGGVPSGGVNENRSAAIEQLKDAKHMLRYKD